MSSEHIVVAIDGPAASGKSSVARALARFTGLVYVNTGAMYRGVTWLALEHGVSPAEPEKVLALLARTKIECGVRDAQSTFLLDGIDMQPHLSTEAVNGSVSRISSIPEVRRILVDLQRRYAHEHHLVMEGRDIGSVVFPETPYKFYIDASPEVRARRRQNQGLLDSIASRDRQDSSRRDSPLVVAPGAHVIDSSSLTIEGVVGETIGRLKEKGLRFIEAPWRLAEAQPAPR